MNYLKKLLITYSDNGIITLIINFLISMGLFEIFELTYHFGYLPSIVIVVFVLMIIIGISQLIVHKFKLRD